MLDVAKQIKDRGANRVFVCTTFGLFTDGFEKFDEYYEKGYIDRVITTNLTYLPAEAKEKPYFLIADMSKFIALIIDSMNHDISIEKLWIQLRRFTVFLRNTTVLCKNTENLPPATSLAYCDNKRTCHWQVLLFNL